MPVFKYHVITTLTLILCALIGSVKTGGARFHFFYSAQFTLCPFQFSIRYSIHTLST